MFGLSSRYVSNCFVVNGLKVGVEMHMMYLADRNKRRLPGIS